MNSEIVLKQEKNEIGKMQRIEEKEEQNDKEKKQEEKLKQPNEKMKLNETERFFGILIYSIFM